MEQKSYSAQKYQEKLVTKKQKIKEQTNFLLIFIKIVCFYNTFKVLLNFLTKISRIKSGNIPIRAHLPTSINMKIEQSILLNYQLLFSLIDRS